MKKSIFTIAILVFALFKLSAQNGTSINTTGMSADPSAMLDVSSTSSGVLIPRMTEVQKNAISSPATGLMIYQTDGDSGFWYYDGSVWAEVKSSGSGAACPPAQAGETLINYHGCLYVKDADESGTYNWDNALIQCASYGAGWYLPTKWELEEALYGNFSQPAIGTNCNGGPCLLTGFNTSTNYWSSTAFSAGDKWSVNMAYGMVTNSWSKSNLLLVRCVRR